MKRQSLTLSIMVLVVLLAAFGPGGLAQASPPSPDASSPARRLITVTGDAEVKVVPDEVILTLGVETSDKDLATAKKQNDEITKRVIALAAAQGVSSKDIQTDYINIEPRYDDSYDHRNFIGYFVRKTIVITLKDITAFEDLLTSELEAGVNYVHGIEFRTTELRKHRDEARALAIRAAREKAVALAGELDQKIGKPVAIQEDYAGWWSGYGAWWGDRWGGGMTQNVIQNSGGNPQQTEGALAPGQISISARVTVSFALK